MNVRTLIEKLRAQDADREVIVVVDAQSMPLAVHGIEFNPAEGEEVMIVTDEL